jgi:hypothetical protein
MRGLELNANMLAAGARFVREATTAPEYRLWSIGDRHPGMMRVREGGAAIAVEVWDVPAAGNPRLTARLGGTRWMDGQAGRTYTSPAGVG